MGIGTPLVKNLVGTFRDLTEEQAKLIKQLGRLADEPEALRTLLDEHCPETSRCMRQCHSDPMNTGMWRRTMVLHAIDKILGTHGVEALGREDHSFRKARIEYCNAGDPYATTLVYLPWSDRIHIGCWGDYAGR